MSVLALDAVSVFSVGFRAVPFLMARSFGTVLFPLAREEQIRYERTHVRRDITRVIGTIERTRRPTSVD